MTKKILNCVVLSAILTPIFADSADSNIKKKRRFYERFSHHTTPTK